MSEFFATLWDLIPGATPADQLKSLSIFLVIIGTIVGWFSGFFTWFFGLFKKSKKPETDTAHTEAAAGAATRELAKQLVEQAGRAQAAETEAEALRDQSLDQNSIAALTEAIEALQKERATKEPESQATIDEALAHLAEGQTEEATVILRTIAEEKARSSAIDRRGAGRIRGQEKSFLYR